jgi:hypothetical protein
MISLRYIDIYFEQLFQIMIMRAGLTTAEAQANGLQTLNSKAMIFFYTLHEKETAFNAGPIPARVWRFANTLHDKLYNEFVNSQTQVDHELSAARQQENEEWIQSFLDETKELQHYHDIDVERTSKKNLQHCWNVIHDPQLVCDSDDEEGILFLTQITQHAWQPPAWRPQQGNLLRDGTLPDATGSRHRTQPAHAGAGGHRTTVDSLELLMT